MFELDRSRLGEDLEETFNFQCAFAKVVCTGLDARFTYNDFISYFKILNSTNMSSRQIGFQSWGVTKFKKNIISLWT